MVTAVPAVDLDRSEEGSLVSDEVVAVRVVGRTRFFSRADRQQPRQQPVSRLYCHTTKEQAAAQQKQQPNTDIIKKANSPSEVVNKEKGACVCGGGLMPALTRP